VTKGAIPWLQEWSKGGARVGVGMSAIGGKPEIPCSINDDRFMSRVEIPGCSEP